MRRNRKPRGQKAPSDYSRFTVKDNKALRDAINVMEGFGKYLSEKRADGFGSRTGCGRAGFARYFEKGKGSKPSFRGP